MIMKRLFGREPDGLDTDTSDEQPSDDDVPIPSDEEASTTDGLRRISAEIEALPQDEHRFVSGYSYILARVALADHDVNEVEVASMVRALTDVGHLTEAQSVLVVEVARNMAVLYGATEDFVVTREFAASSTREQREDLLRTAFVIGAADSELSAAESDELDEIGKELGFRSDEIDAIREASGVRVKAATPDGDPIVEPWGDAATGLQRDTDS